MDQNFPVDGDPTASNPARHPRVDPVMIDVSTTEGRLRVADVRAAAAAHRSSWEALVPSHFEVNLDAEAAEEAAYSDMAEAKARLRDHICETYGISIKELSSLAMI